MNSNNLLHTAGAGRTGFSSGYLAAKKTIDDRALNSHVWLSLKKAFEGSGRAKEPRRILEAGAGIGTMFARVVERNVLSGRIDYLATDNDPDQQQAARDYLTDWARMQGRNLSWPGRYRGRLHSVDADISLILDCRSIEELAGKAQILEPVHLLLAHAVLDLIDIEALLPCLLTRLIPGGLAYFSGNFDGETIFLPVNAADEEIMRRYHDSMEVRQAGASHTGRRLLGLLQRADVEILAAGSSDWIIFPRNHRYSADATFFLHAIINTVARELVRQNYPPADLDTWTELRHHQVRTGQLSFLARHLDLLIRYQPLRS